MGINIVVGLVRVSVQGKCVGDLQDYLVFINLIKEKGYGICFISVYNLEIKFI